MLRCYWRRDFSRRLTDKAEVQDMPLSRIALSTLMLALWLAAGEDVGRAELFQVQQVQTHETSTYTQLRYGDEGLPFSEIAEQIAFDNEFVVLRLLGGFTTETNRELLDFYEREIPEALAKASASAGNLHNPALAPLLERFSAAFRSTRMFHEIEAGLAARGYSVERIEVEKFMAHTEESLHLFAGGLWLYLKETQDSR